MCTKSWPLAPQRRRLRETSRTSTAAWAPSGRRRFASAAVESNFAKFPHACKPWSTSAFEETRMPLSRRGVTGLRLARDPPIAPTPPGDTGLEVPADPPPVLTAQTFSKVSAIAFWTSRSGSIKRSSRSSFRYGIAFDEIWAGVQSCSRMRQHAFVTACTSPRRTVGVCTLRPGRNSAAISYTSSRVMQSRKATTDSLPRRASSFACSAALAKIRDAPAQGAPDVAPVLDGRCTFTSPTVPGTCNGCRQYGHSGRRRRRLQ